MDEEDVGVLARPAAAAALPRLSGGRGAADGRTVSRPGVTLMKIKVNHSGSKSWDLLSTTSSPTNTTTGGKPDLKGLSDERNGKKKRWASVCVTGTKA